ncbi:hypothetical protein BHE74_00028905 [Ensete ventricosum]|nr:hypothetical protein BHE74_00028905 [Ensete ventricosum]
MCVIVLLLLCQMEKNAAAGRTPSSLPMSTPPPLANLTSPKFGALSPVRTKSLSAKSESINSNVAVAYAEDDAVGTTAALRGQTDPSDFRPHLGDDRMDRYPADPCKRQQRAALQFFGALDGGLVEMWPGTTWCHMYGDGTSADFSVNAVNVLDLGLRILEGKAAVGSNSREIETDKREESTDGGGGEDCAVDAVVGLRESGVGGRADAAFRSRLASHGHHGSYRPVHTNPVADRYADRRYRAVPLKSIVGGRLRKKREEEEEEEKEEKKKEEEEKYLARVPSPPTGRPCCCRPRATFLPVRGDGTSPSRGERSR